MPYTPIPVQKISFNTKFNRIKNMYCQSFHEEKSVYKPAPERWNLYKSIWLKYWPEFEKLYPFRFEKFYGPLDEEKVDEVKKPVQCGDFKNGFQRHICHNFLKYRIKDTVYLFRADNAIKRLLKTHAIIGGVEANSHVLCGFDIRASMPVIF